MSRQRLLIVDDEPNVWEGLRRVLQPQQRGWELSFAADADTAARQLQTTEFDVVICDIRLPGRDGLMLLKELRAAPHTRDLPVVILTGLDEPQLTRRALDLGATDLLRKPADPDELLARVRSALRLKVYQDRLKQHSALLERLVAERTAQLADSRLDIIWRLGNAAEYRDEATGNHVMRVACMARVLAEGLELPADAVEQIFLAAPLHDIGKIGIPDHILFKPAELTAAEWAIMRRHCEIGARILERESKMLFLYRAWRDARRVDQTQLDNPFLKTAAEVALAHHERWDGLGYPRGLSQSQIPLSARIVSLADVYDALLSERPYRAAYTEDEALGIIRGWAGSHFDPAVHAALEAALPQLRELRADLADSACPVPATV